MIAWRRGRANPRSARRQRAPGRCGWSGDQAGVGRSERVARAGNRSWCWAW